MDGPSGVAQWVKTSESYQLKPHSIKLDFGT